MKDWKPETPGPPDSAERRVICELLDEKPIGRYELFLTQREGLKLGGGLESVSGFVLTERDIVYTFWLEWDAERRRYFLHPFDMMRDDGDLQDIVEYQQARRRLGMSWRDE